MSLIGVKNKCPGCHRPQKNRKLCSACARTPALFAGMETRPKPPPPPAEQFSLFNQQYGLLDQGKFGRK
jgi:hypothetical protein